MSVRFESIIGRTSACEDVCGCYASRSAESLAHSVVWVQMISILAGELNSLSGLRSLVINNLTRFMAPVCRILLHFYLLL